MLSYFKLYLLLFEVRLWWSGQVHGAAELPWNSLGKKCRMDLLVLVSTKTFPSQRNVLCLTARAAASPYLMKKEKLLFYLMCALIFLINFENLEGKKQGFKPSSWWKKTSMYEFYNLNVQTPPSCCKARVLTLTPLCRPQKHVFCWYFSDFPLDAIRCSFFVSPTKISVCSQISFCVCVFVLQILVKVLRLIISPDKFLLQLLVLILLCLISREIDTGFYRLEPRILTPETQQRQVSISSLLHPDSSINVLGFIKKKSILQDNYISFFYYVKLKLLRYYRLQRQKLALHALQI